MTYSRRELYALGEPLGDSATYRKADGGLILGGGGSSAPSSPTQTQTQVQDLPDWAKPYAQNVLSQGAALTDINQNPYQPYGGNRIAGFTDLQNQAFQGAQNMAPSQQLNTGTALAGVSGLGGLGVAGQANPQNFQQNVGGYMNPYMQQVLNPQLDELRRQYGITGTQQAGQATQAGAFGGSRDAIMAAENQRNLGTAQNQAIGQAYGNAFTNAQNQYNANMQNQLAGFGLANQAAGQLGQLGQTQYGQQMGINQLQNQYGAQQQALNQQGLTTAYNDFLAQKNYPYQQLSYMANLVHNTPMGMNTTSQVYQAPPTGAQTLGALGLGAYGLSKIAGGGLAEDAPKYGIGGSVLSRGFKDAAVAKIPTNEGLQAAAQGAQARGDINTQLEAQGLMKQGDAIRQEDAAINRGIAGQLPEQFADNMVRAARGGIMAFKEGDVVDDSEDDERVTTDQDGASIGFTGTPSQQAMAQGFLASQARLQNAPQYEPLTRKGRLSAQQRSYEDLKTMAGPDPYGAYEKQLAEDKDTSAKVLEQNKGLAALQAIPAVLQPGGTLRAFGAGLGALGTGFAKAGEADRAEKRYLGQMQFHLADAKRKENMGMYAEARKDVQDAEVARLNAIKEYRARETASGGNFAKMAQALRAPAGSGGAGKLPQVDRDAAVLAKQIVDLKNKDPNDKQIPLLESKLTALKDIIATTKTSDIGANKAEIENKKIFGNISLKAADEARKSALAEASSKNVWGAKDADAKFTEIYKRKYDEAIGRHAETIGKSKDEITQVAPMPEHGVKNPNAAPAAKQTTGAAGAPDIKSVSGAPAGATIGRKTLQGYEILDSTGKLIGYAKGTS
jgi:hypothetical protein